MRTHIFIIALAIAAVGSAPGAVSQGNDSVCLSGGQSAALDFWVGSWRVTDPSGDQEYGTNRVEKALEGCAVFEHWTSARGGAGKSLFYYDARSDNWTQVWVTADTSRPGGLKIKRLIGRLEDGSSRFQGEIQRADGGLYLDRTTLTPLEDGTVRQLIETSLDGGQNWRTTFDAVYRPVEN